MVRRDAGLGLHPPQQGIEAAHGAQALETDGDRVAIQDGRAAGKTAETAHRHDRNVALVAPRDDRGDLVGGARQHERPRRRARDGRVADDRAAPHVRGTDDPLELLHRPHARRRSDVAAPP